jgi:hypothetical protein
LRFGLILCIVFAVGMPHFISGRLNWQQKVLYSYATGIIMLCVIGEKNDDE